MSHNDHPLIIYKTAIKKTTEIAERFQTKILTPQFKILNEDIEETVFAEESDLTSKGLQQKLIKSNYTVQKNKFRLFYIFWSIKLQESGNFNKLLKFFEEPPKRTLIVLIINEHVLPKTITSRGISICDQELINHLPKSHSEAYQNIKSKLINYINGPMQLSDLLTILNSDKEASEEVFIDFLSFLTKQNLNCQKYAILGKMLNKYSQSRKINLNKFDNILIPLRHIASAENIDISKF